MGENVVDLRKEKERRNLSAGEDNREALRAVTAEDLDENTQEEDQPPQAQAEELFTWDALEFVEHEKERYVWIRNTVIAVVPVVLFLLFTKNLLGAATIAIGAFAFLGNAFRSPSHVHFAIRRDGVVVGARMFSYEHIESFWIFTEDEDKVLSLKRKELLLFPLRMPLGDVEEESVRTILGQYIPEEEQHISLIDGILRRIGY